MFLLKSIKDPELIRLIKQLHTTRKKNKKLYLNELSKLKAVIKIIVKEYDLVLYRMKQYIIDIKIGNDEKTKYKIKEAVDELIKINHLILKFKIII